MKHSDVFLFSLRVCFLFVSTSQNEFNFSESGKIELNGMAKKSEFQQDFFSFLLEFSNTDILNLSFLFPFHSEFIT